MTKLIEPIVADDAQKLPVESAFEQAFQESVMLATATNVTLDSEDRPTLNLRAWKRSKGGLKEVDRILLADIYRNASSIFEYGLGESTRIAGAVGVPRYAGIDSDAAWFSSTRSEVPSHFRFYLADIGATKEWGYPEESLQKQILDYQLAPMHVEQQPFDVYLVDRRWRIACALIAFLHASARGARPADTTVLLHDCVIKNVTSPYLYRSTYRAEYEILNSLFIREKHSGEALCVYKRKSTTIDDDIYRLWEQGKARML